MIRLAHRNAYDVALIFSQDQDLSELCAEIRVIAREQNRCPDYAEGLRDDGIGDGKVNLTIGRIGDASAT